MFSNSFDCHRVKGLGCLALFFLILFCPFRLCSEDSTNTSSCVTCHQDMQEELRGSAHDRAGISCHHCHGGDPKQEDYELAMSKEAGFTPLNDKKQIALTCGGCHANVEFMNFWGLNTDQLARYRTSVHGKRILEEEDFNAATCTDCHGHHKVLGAKNPKSPMYPATLPHTCNNCHGNEELMDKYGLPSDIFEKYSKSVHGIAVLEKGDTSAATCVSCHGSHGAVPPGAKDVSSTCGKCHVNERKYFLESPHAQLTEKGVFSECDSCHGHHSVQPATLELYRKMCIECHAEGSSQADLGKTIYEMLGTYRDSLAKAEEVVKQASIEGIFVDEEEAALDEIKTQVVLSAPEQHSLSIQKVSAHKEAIIDGTKDIVSKIDAKRDELKWRELSLVPIWIFALVMMAALWMVFLRLKSPKKQEKEGPAEKKEDRITRRDFLGWVVKGGLSATMIGLVAPAIAYIWPVIRRGPVTSLVEVGSVDEIPVWGSKKLIIGGSPILVVRTPTGYNAVSAICTHLGCVVGWNGGKREIICPCHAGIFDAEGKVLSGPPPRPLPKYTVQVQGNKIFIKL